MSIQPDNPPAAAEPIAPPQPKDEKGRFAPKPSDENPPEPIAEPAKEKIKDDLLDEIEQDLQTALKGRFDPKDLSDLDQRMRIKMLRILSKVDNGKRNPTVDPTTPPPPSEKVFPTLAEINKADKYRADFRQQTSYLAQANKWRNPK